jgi:hypothetical protein
MAVTPCAVQWFNAADGARHPLIEISSDCSEDEVTAGGSCGALAPLDPAAALAGDASEDDECEEEVVVAGALKRTIIIHLIRMFDFLHTI